MCVSRTVYASEYKIFTKRSGKRIRRVGGGPREEEEDEEWWGEDGGGGANQLSPPSWGSSPSPCVSDVHSVRLSLNSCMMSVESL